MNHRRRMKPGSMGRERVNAELAYARAFGSIDTPSWPMLKLKQADGRGMAPIDLRQRDID